MRIVFLPYSNAFDGLIDFTKPFDIREKIRDQTMRMFNILSSIIGTIDTLITGGKYGPSVASEHSYNYSKWQKKRDKDFAQFGAHSCKICSTKIPANKSYCGSCYFKYVRK